MDGLILVHKPEKLTSHDVVFRIRQILGLKKVGHYGTLDPFATGLMVIAVGQATRLFPFYLKTDKTYTAQIRLGLATDTYDLFGKPTTDEVHDFPDKNQVIQKMNGFIGDILQVPPLYSAKKFKGKPLYVLARENKKVELKPNPVTVHRFELSNYNPPYLECIVVCSSGTYIRSLAHDLGQSLGCGAHLSQLVRTSVGTFVLEESFCLEDITKLAHNKKFMEFIIPLESLLPEYPKIILTETGSKLARNGNTIFPENILRVPRLCSTESEFAAEKDSLYRLFSPEGQLLALARRISDKNGLHPFLVIDSGNSSQ